MQSAVRDITAPVILVFTLLGFTTLLIPYRNNSLGANPFVESPLKDFPFFIKPLNKYLPTDAPRVGYEPQTVFRSPVHPHNCQHLLMDISSSI